MGTTGLGILFLLRCLLAAGWLVWGATTQAVSVGLTSSRVAYQAIYMRDYIVDSSVNRIALAGELDCFKLKFPQRWLKANPGKDVPK
jgi:hypothetical protein